MIKLTRLPCPDPEVLKSNYKHAINKEALKNSTFGKCMYCESKIEHIDYGDIEHIKPKSLFPNEKYVWDNLGYACIKCNRDAKNDLYDTNFINPFEQDPNDYLIAIGGIFISKNGHPNGQITIDILKLNRVELLQKRNISLVSFQELINRYISSQSQTQKAAIKTLILDEIAADKEYSACKMAFIQMQEIEFS